MWPVMVVKLHQVMDVSLAVQVPSLSVEKVVLTDSYPSLLLLSLQESLFPRLFAVTSVGGVFQAPSL